MNTLRIDQKRLKRWKVYMNVKIKEKDQDN